MKMYYIEFKMSTNKNNFFLLFTLKLVFDCLIFMVVCVFRLVVVALILNTFKSVVFNVDETSKNVSDLVEHAVL